MNGYDSSVHDACIFSDNPGIADFILRYKAVFQANNRLTTVGESATNIYALSVNTHMKPIIVTMNKEDDYDKIRSEDSYRWIRENSFLLDCGSDKLYDAEEPESESQHDAAREASWNGMNL